MRAFRNLLFGLTLICTVVMSGCGGTASVAGISPVTRGKWTVLVYMNAANDLDTFSRLNVTQMQQVATNPDVRFVVQWKQSTKVTFDASFNGTRRYLIKQGSGNAIVSQLVQDMGTGVDMGVPQTVNNFIAWGKAHYPADHYALVLWDHGNGWLPGFKGAKPSTRPFAISYDDETGHSIQVWQLNQAFKNQHLDIVAFDASLMQMDEVAYQIKDYTDFIAGSEESPPGAGYPYQRVFAPFSNTPDASPKDLSKAFVDGMLNEPTYSTFQITQSVIDTSQLPGLATAASALQSALVANRTSVNAIIAQARANTQAYLPTNTRYFYDSIGLCNQLAALTGNADIQTACANYNTAASNAIVWEGHNSMSPGSHGIAIDFSPNSFFSTVSGNYAKLDWNTASQWSQWLSVAQ